MLYGLMGRSVFADTDRVMRQYINDRQLHDGRQPHRGLHIIRKHKECGAEDFQASMQRDTVGDSGHRMLTYTEMQVASGTVISAVVAAAGNICLIGRCQISRPADKVGDQFGEAIDHRAGTGTCRFALAA